MAGIKISDLPAIVAPALSDVFPVDQGLVTYKESAQQLLTLFQNNGAALTKTDDTNVTLTLGGSPTIALLNATSLTLGWTGQLSVARGGTGNSTFTAYSVICAGTTATGAFQNVSGLGTANQVLVSNGAGTLPTWQTVPGLTPAALTKTDDTNVTLTLGGTPSTALLQATSLTLGWTGTLSGTRGGTGVNNGANTATYAGNLSFAGSFTTSGAFSVTQTYTAGTNVTFPTSGTLATTSQLPTPAALTKIDDTNITLTLGGTPTTALLQATSLTLGWTGQLGVSRGGTGVAALTAHYLLIGNGTSAVTLLAPSATSGIPLISQGASADPAYGTAVVAGGGTGNTTFTAYSVICAGTTATGIFQNVSGVGTANQVLTSNGAGALPTWQSVPGLTPAALTKTDDTNVTLTLGGTPATALLQATSLTLGWTGQLGLTRGGTAASLTASNGGIVYSNASTLAILAGTATARQMLQSGASTTPAWSTTTWPATTTANRILYSSATSVIGEITSANSSVLVTDGSGVPSFSTTLPAFTTSSITFNPTTGGIVGTTTNDNAAAGKVGEFISSVIALASGLSLSSGVSADLTSISLTAGDWDIWGNVGFSPTGTTTNNAAWTSTVSATPPDLSLYNNDASTVSGSAYCVPGQRLSLSGTTTVYLSVFATFGVSCKACGGIYARRVR
jgi:hypothetical protein